MPGTGDPETGSQPTATETSVSHSGDERAVEFLLRFARAGHEVGYPTADLEERVISMAETLGLDEVQVSATPTAVDISFGAVQRQRSFVLRVRPTAVDLDAIARLDDLVQDVLAGKVGSDTALARLDELQAAPLERPWPLLLGAYALAGAALTPVLGGGWREAIAGALVGLVVGAIALPARHRARTEPIVAPVAALAASFCAAALVELDTASALVQLLGLVFGVGIGRSIAESWFGPTGDLALDSSFSGTHIVAAVAAWLAFTLTLQARYRDAIVMCSATVLALSARELGSIVFGDQAAVFVAALAVGMAGGLVGRLLNRSPLVFVVPGVLMLVPGSAGFASALQFLSDQTVTGIAAAFDTFVTAMSIAYGLLVSAVILPRRVTGARHGPAETTP